MWQGVVADACNPSTQEVEGAKQEDLESRACWVTNYQLQIKAEIK
jgi:hypothetical protein